MNGGFHGLLADYTDQSFVIAPDGSVLEGPSQMKPAFAAIIAEFAKPGASFSVDKTVIKGEVAFVTWSAETADNVYEFATDTFVVRDGKIASQTFTGKITPKS